MDRLTYPAGGAFFAAFVSGPIFVLSLALAEYYSQLPAAVPVSGEAVFALPMIAVTIPFGFLIAVLPCLAGAALMTGLSGLTAMRGPAAWLLMGCALPLLLALFSWVEWGPGIFALSMTGGACALICRRSAKPAD